jgi:hypothetical protein
MDILDAVKKLADPADRADLEALEREKGRAFVLSRVQLLLPDAIHYALSELNTILKAAEAIPEEERQRYIQQYRSVRRHLGG